MVCWHIVGIDDWHCYELLLDTQNESAISAWRGKGQILCAVLWEWGKSLNVFHDYSCLAQILNINAESCLNQKDLKS